MGKTLTSAEVINSTDPLKTVTQWMDENTDTVLIIFSVKGKEHSTTRYDFEHADDAIKVIRENNISERDISIWIISEGEGYLFPLRHPIPQGYDQPHLLACILDGKIRS